MYVYIFKRIFGFDLDVIERSFFSKKNYLVLWIWNNLEFIKDSFIQICIGICRDACVLFESILDFRIF